MMKSTHMLGGFAAWAAACVWVTGPVDVIDVSVVPDDHEFGVDDDGFLHIKGEILTRRAA